MSSFYLLPWTARGWLPEAVNVFDPQMHHAQVLAHEASVSATARLLVARWQVISSRARHGIEGMSSKLERASLGEP
jgi:hypothetical protein